MLFSVVPLRSIMLEQTWVQKTRLLLWISNVSLDPQTVGLWSISYLPRTLWAAIADSSALLGSQEQSFILYQHGVWNFSCGTVWYSPHLTLFSDELFMSSPQVLVCQVPWHKSHWYCHFFSTAVAQVLLKVTSRTTLCLKPFITPISYYNTFKLN